MLIFLFIWSFLTQVYSILLLCIHGHSWFSEDGHMAATQNYS